MNILEVKNISKTFKLSKKQMKQNHTSSNKLVAVDNLSLTLKSGVIYGLLGPNGAGKTTSLRIISSLFSPDTGEVFYNDEAINKNIRDYRRKVGFLTSELKLDDFFTPSYTFYYMSKLYGISDEEIANNEKELFKRFGVEDFKNTAIKNLSTGMKQKVSLAVSLCNDPEIIIFDEPTNGLDIIAARDVENFLIDLKKKNKIILISTHIFSLVDKLCDEVGFIINGKLVFEESVKTISAKYGTVENAFFEFYKEKDFK